MVCILVPSQPITLLKDANPTIQSKSKEPSPTLSLKTFRNINELKQLLAKLTKTGSIQSPSTLSNLLSTCSKLGSSESLNYTTKLVFEQLEQNEEMGNRLVLWNSLIRGYSLIGKGEEAISVYLKMVIQGVLPDNFTYPFVLSGCTKSKAFEVGIQVHGSAVKMGFGVDVYIQNSLIHFYAESGDMRSARMIFDEMTERNVVTWTSLVCGYARGDCPKEAVSLFFEMMESGVSPNSVTMACVISACAKTKNLELANKIYSYIGQGDVQLNAVLVNALVDMYMKCGAKGTAKRLFDECDDRNLVLYNTVMKNFVHEGMAKEAIVVFREMLESGVHPDRVTMLAVISASADLGYLAFGSQCHAYVLRNGLDRWDSVMNSSIDMYMKSGELEMACRVFDLMLNKTTVSWNTLVAGYIRNGDMESALRIFSSMPKKDLVSWNTIIGALVQESWFEEAIELFREMQNVGVTGDKITMVAVASSCGYLGAIDLAKWVHTYIKTNEIECDMLLNTALVDMYARCGDPTNSMQVFDEMDNKDVSAWTAAIGAMAMVGDGDRAIRLFEEMIRHGVRPDGVTFVGVLTACSHSGLVEQGKHIFMSMEDVNGISPQIVHYGCIVDLLGRAGFLHEAHDLIKSMPMEPNSVIWGALLAACRMHSNVEMATYAAERVTELAPHRTGLQVLLSNVYASAGRWADVARVRTNLKEKGNQKIPGSSSVEVNGKFHEFTSNNESHPQMTHIATMLDEMCSSFKNAGYVPNLDNVLLHVDEHEKELLLSRHSEKLSLAFGLISTEKQSQIRIVKNLRMCSDCHSFTKLASKVYDREIVVRDNNRFHFFRQGLCSCNDYW